MMIDEMNMRMKKKIVEHLSAKVAREGTMKYLRQP